MSSTLLNGSFIFKENSKSTVICKYCSKEFKYHRSFSSLKYHISNKHTFALANISEPMSSTLNQQPTIAESINSSSKSISSEKSQKITQAIVHWIAKNGRPLNIVSDCGLRDLLRVATSNNNYSLPCRKTIKSRLNELFEKEKEIKMEMIRKTKFVAITCDHWTSISNDSFLGVTCHWIDDDWKMNSFTLGVHNCMERHTSDNVLNQFRVITDEWECYHKIISVGTDNGRNIFG